MAGEPQGAVAELNGLELHYDVQGAGEPLLMLHGMTGCAGDWAYAGRDQFLREYRLITPDARGHGRSTNSGKSITHRQCALDTLALLDHLGIGKCRAIGVSFGGNILLHLAKMEPQRFEAMVLVSATMRFPDQARRIMREFPVGTQPPEAWEMMRRRHAHGDAQILALWEQCRALADSYDDVNFTAADLSRITAPTLVVYGDRDPLYPVEMAVEMYRALPRPALWVVPNGGHGPVFFDAAAQFAQTALGFFRASKEPAQA
jgi:pimeloyl-ACP methyl ester carboxylesterase